MIKTLVLFFFIIQSFSSFGQNSYEQMIDLKDKNISLTAEGKLEIYKFGKKEETKSFKVFFQNQNKREKILLEFISPQKIKGVRNLIIQNKKNGYRAWIKLKENSMIRELKKRKRCKSLFGSEFSCDDLYLSLFGMSMQFKFEKKGVLNNENVDIGVLSFGNASNKYRIYLSFIKKWPLKIDILTSFGKVHKEIHFLDYYKIDEKWFVKKIEITNLRNQKRSVLSWTNIKAGFSIPADLLDPTKMSMNEK